MVRWIGLVIVMTLSLAGPVRAAELVATVDRQQVMLGDTLRLVLRSDGDVDPDSVDLQPLLVDFDVLQRARSSSTRIVNGIIERTTELTVTIAPRRAGQLSIPALVADRARTQSIPIEVSEMPTGAPAGQAVFIEVDVDREWVYVQGQLLLTIRIYQAQALDERRISDIDVSDAVVHFLDQASYQRKVDDQIYQVAEVRYAVFPEQSGTLRIPAVTFSAREASPRRGLFDFGGGGRLLRRQSEARDIEVRARPAAFPRTASWLPSVAVTLEESFSSDPSELRAGESITRTVTLSGSALQAVQLPSLPATQVEGLRSYPNPDAVQELQEVNGLIARRSRSEALLATREGAVELPAIRVQWWDTQADQLREASLPARQLHIAAGVNAAIPSAPILVTDPMDSVSTAAAAATPATPNPTWIIATVVFAVLWLATLALWLRGRGAAVPSGAASDEPALQQRSALRDLQRCCIRHDAPGAHRALLSWADTMPGRPRSLTALARQIDDATFTAALQSLEQALYAPSGGSWRGDDLAAALRRLATARPQPAAEMLALYPQ